MTTASRALVPANQTNEPHERKDKTYPTAHTVPGRSRGVRRFAKVFHGDGAYGRKRRVNGVYIPTRCVDSQRLIGIRCILNLRRMNHHANVEAFEGTRIQHIQFPSIVLYTMRDRCQEGTVKPTTRNKAMNSPSAGVPSNFICAEILCFSMTAFIPC
jgi:hypothetical protein